MKNKSLFLLIAALILSATNVSADAAINPG